MNVDPSCHAPCLCALLLALAWVGLAGGRPAMGNALTLPDSGAPACERVGAHRPCELIMEEGVTRLGLIYIDLGKHAAARAPLIRACLAAVSETAADQLVPADVSVRLRVVWPGVVVRAEVLEEPFRCEPLASCITNAMLLFTAEPTFAALERQEMFDEDVTVRLDDQEVCDSSLAGIDRLPTRGTCVLGLDDETAGDWERQVAPCARRCLARSGRSGEDADAGVRATIVFEEDTPVRVYLRARETACDAAPARCLRRCALGDRAPRLRHVGRYSRYHYAMFDWGPSQTAVLSLDGTWCDSPQDVGQSRRCVSTNRFGRCTGTQECVAPRRWSHCTARQPALEVRDCADNDCDGLTDEEQ